MNIINCKNAVNIFRDTAGLLMISDFFVNEYNVIKSAICINMHKAARKYFSKNVFVFY